MPETTWIDIVRYNVGAGGNRNVPVSVDEGSAEEWALVQDNGVVQRGFKTKREAIESWECSTIPPGSGAYLVRIRASVSQEGRV